ncbi:ADP-ribosyl-(dinitrogen reductase) hydrolase [Pararobbsia silviterrae]|uniref:ADP-ribosyl-(Dinitrogen reductase) hydrolase n=1 Tax=Pararobbsia silviterrae TaxID=1792498 RepID=A0A494XZU2_9BURK|nr:ADP-ribosyl-(dinitrogen reductase) hydrolase [Pararobbsia silviterrae]RKP56037.1 ADP-ribosyl-(dinitrogen reductase) hydrolase [Pararobbsia silviterrae]
MKQDEILECFANRVGRFLFDTREDHQSDPCTRWFIAETNFGRKLKVAFIARGRVVTIRTAYDPNDEEVRIYNKYGMQAI